MERQRDEKVHRGEDPEGAAPAGGFDEPAGEWPVEGRGDAADESQHGDGAARLVAAIGRKGREGRAVEDGHRKDLQHHDQHGEDGEGRRYRERDVGETHRRGCRPS